LSLFLKKVPLQQAATLLTVVFNVVFVERDGDWTIVYVPDKQMMSVEKNPSIK